MDPASLALAHAFDSDRLPFPDHGPLSFLRARRSPLLERAPASRWHCQQPFKPWADALIDLGLDPARPAEPDTVVLSLCLLPRQRDEARAVLAQALLQAQTGAMIVAAVAKDEGARSREADLAALAGPVEALSKHHCRVFWTRKDPAGFDKDLLASWLAADCLQPLPDCGLLSRPGLFCWDRVDAGSALLAEHLPRGFAGSAADLGAGWGYLSVELLRRSPGLRHLDLYEADARALEAAGANLPVDTRIGLHWHDVCRGLPRRYELLISNPPFHQGRADQPELGRAFIRSAASALEPGGEALLVANRHLPYEATLRECFTSVEALAGRDGYKLLRARGPRP